jgi:uncharacterized protein
VKPLPLFEIKVDDIKESGQPWEADLPREDLDAMLLADPPTEFHAGGAAHVRAKLTKMGRKVLVQSKFTVPLAGLCKRCLKAVAVDEPVDLTLTYNPAPEQSKASKHKEHKEHKGVEGEQAGRKGKRDDKPAFQQGETEASFDPAAADEETYSGKLINFSPALREAVLLAVPPSPLCKEDCKGLCLTCGQDLNEADCGHVQKTVDPRWGALRKLKLEPKQEPKKE